MATDNNTGDTITDFRQYNGKRVRVVAEFDVDEGDTTSERIDSEHSTIRGREVVSVEIVKPAPKPGQVWRDSDGDLMFIHEYHGTRRATQAEGRHYHIDGVTLVDLVFDPESDCSR